MKIIFSAVISRGVDQGSLNPGKISLISAQGSLVLQYLTASTTPVNSNITWHHPPNYTAQAAILHPSHSETQLHQGSALRQSPDYPLVTPVNTSTIAPTTPASVQCGSSQVNWRHYISLTLLKTVLQFRHNSLPN